MTTSVLGLSIDCADPAALADFWAKALGRPVSPGAGPEYAAIDATAPAYGPQLTFHKVLGTHGPRAPNRQEPAAPGPDHRPVPGRDRTADRPGRQPRPGLRETGARWTTITDPEGNEFDLVAD
jgi:hypothetical protein